MLPLKGNKSLWREELGEGVGSSTQGLTAGIGLDSKHGFQNPPLPKKCPFLAYFVCLLHVLQVQNSLSVGLR